MQQRRQPDQGWFGLERVPLPWIVVAMAAMAVAMVAALVAERTWWQVIGFPLAATGAFQWWRAAAAYRASNE